jgi:hypothetical protein
VACGCDLCGCLCCDHGLLLCVVSSAPASPVDTLSGVSTCQA